MKCTECPDLAGYYPYKTAVKGRPRLVAYYCEHRKLKSERTGSIARTRYDLYEKMKTKPRWCPRIDKGAK